MITPRKRSGRRSRNTTEEPSRAFWRARNSALVSRIRYSRSSSFNRAAASAPLPAPSSRIGPSTAAIWRASVRAKSSPNSGAVTKSPSAPNFCAPFA